MDDDGGVIGIPSGMGEAFQVVWDGHSSWYGRGIPSGYESSEVRRDSFIIPGIEESFSALTQNLAFFP